MNRHDIKCYQPSTPKHEISKKKTVKIYGLYERKASKTERDNSQEKEQSKDKLMQDYWSDSLPSLALAYTKVLKLEKNSENNQQYQLKKTSLSFSLAYQGPGTSHDEQPTAPQRAVSRLS